MTLTIAGVVGLEDSAHPTCCTLPVRRFMISQLLPRPTAVTREAGRVVRYDDPLLWEPLSRGCIPAVVDTSNLACADRGH